ncbi:MAG: hypothetical protein ABEI39_01850 [Halobacteriales archaeon]
MVIEVLAGVEADRFEGREDLEATLAPVFGAEREARVPGLPGRLRRLFGYCGAPLRGQVSRSSLGARTASPLPSKAEGSGGCADRGPG